MTPYDYCVLVASVYVAAALASEKATNTILVFAVVWTALAVLA